MDKYTFKEGFNTGKFIYGFTSNFRRLIIDFFQVLFKYHSLAAKYRYDEDEKKSKIFIGSYSPQIERTFPRMLIQVDLAKGSPFSIGQSANDGMDYYSAVGRVDYDVSIDIVAQEDTVVKEIADLVLIFIVAPFMRMQLERFGIVLKLNEGINAERVTISSYTSEMPVWTTRIRFGFYSEWRQNFEYKGIKIKGEIVELEI